MFKKVDPLDTEQIDKLLEKRVTPEAPASLEDDIISAIHREQRAEIWLIWRTPFITIGMIALFGLLIMSGAGLSLLTYTIESGVSGYQFKDTDITSTFSPDDIYVYDFLDQMAG